MSSSEIPDEIVPRLDELRTAAAVAFQLQNWAIAAERLDATYRFLLEQQQRLATRFHKGWELHNGGVAYLNFQRFADGVRRIILAYVEDALSADTGEEAHADRGTAGFVLGGLGVQPRLLDSIRSVAREMKESRAGVPGDPEFVLARALDDLSIPGVTLDQELARRAAEDAASRPKRTIVGVTSPFERRCFVGGNYFIGGPNLEEIRRSVVSSEFDAILVDDFDIPSDRVHHDSLLLLHLCTRAIFEITVPAGQLMELERCRDYNIRPLSCATRDQTRIPSSLK